MSHFSTFLFASPSFMEGAGRSIDLFGVFSEYNSSPSTELADYFALYGDWAAVADDIKHVMAENRRGERAEETIAQNSGGNQQHSLALPLQESAILHQVVRQEISQSSWQGPIPPPDALREFNEIIPDGANRILSMAERQSAHRIELEKLNLRGDIARSNLGMWFAFILASGAIIAGSCVAIFRDPRYGAAIAAVPSVGIITAFIYGKVAQRSERENRLQAMLNAVTAKGKPKI
jgi:uncharacterized membrane protein